MHGERIFGPKVLACLGWKHALNDGRGEKSLGNTATGDTHATQHAEVDWIQRKRADCTMLFVDRGLSIDIIFDLIF